MKISATALMHHLTFNEQPRKVVALHVNVPLDSRDLARTTNVAIVLDPWLAGVYELDGFMMGKKIENLTVEGVPLLFPGDELLDLSRLTVEEWSPFSGLTRHEVEIYGGVEAVAKLYNENGGWASPSSRRSEFAAL